MTAPVRSQAARIARANSTVAISWSLASCWRTGETMIPARSSPASATAASSEATSL
jgi:hypothetical protein